MAQRFRIKGATAVFALLIGAFGAWLASDGISDLGRAAAVERDGLSVSARVTAVTARPRGRDVEARLSYSLAGKVYQGRDVLPLGTSVGDVTTLLVAKSNPALYAADPRAVSARGTYKLLAGIFSFVVVAFGIAISSKRLPGLMRIRV